MTEQLTRNPIIISDEELKSLTDAIHTRHGIDFSCYEPLSLKRRIVRVLHVFKLDSVIDLWTKILKDHSFIYPFMDEISVGLTSMFRDPVLWKKMRQLLTRDLKKTEELSIWHAGCSTGEEVYTMGIVFKESLFSSRYKVRATDISNQAILTAKNGIYNALRFDEYDKNYKLYNPQGKLKRYYDENGDTFVMRSELIQHVTFEHHNLITDQFSGRYDVIFCRNVMIYFDNNAKRKLFDKFYSVLNPGGLFIIGFYDAVLPLVDPAKFDILDFDAKIFVRK